MKLLIAVLACAGILWADGGTLILRQVAGPLTISVFSSPSPLRVGGGDVSVMLQKTADHSAVLDATVKLHFTHSTADGISEVFLPATHAKASNKLLYAANVKLVAAGAWKLAVNVESKPGSAEVAGNLNVLPPQPPLLAYWPYFALVPFIVLLFLFNQWLRRRRITPPHPRANA